MGNLVLARGDDDDAMNMVGHDRVFVQFQIWEAGREAAPHFVGQLAGRAQLNALAAYFAEALLALFSANGDEIGSGLGIVIALETDRAPVVGRQDGRVDGHNSPLNAGRSSAAGNSNPCVGGRCSAFASIRATATGCVSLLTLTRSV